MALDESFTDASIGCVLRELARTGNRQPATGNRHQGPFWVIYEIGKGETGRSNEGLCRKKHMEIRSIFDATRDEIERFQESVSGWILEQDIKTLLYGLKCDENEREK